MPAAAHPLEEEWTQIPLGKRAQRDSLPLWLQRPSTRMRHTPPQRALPSSRDGNHSDCHDSSGAFGQFMDQKAESPRQELIQALSRRNPKSQESLHVLHFGEGFPLDPPLPPLGSAAGGGGGGAPWRARVGQKDRS